MTIYGDANFLSLVACETDDLGKIYVAIDIRYPRAATVMLRKASRRDHPSSYLVLRGTVYDDIDHKMVREDRHKQSRVTAFGGDRLLLTV